MRRKTGWETVDALFAKADRLNEELEKLQAELAAILHTEEPEDSHKKKLQSV